MSLSAIKYANPPAQAAVCVKGPGPELAIEFFLRFGGAKLPLSDNPGRGSKRVVFLAVEMARALARQNQIQLRVPLASRWLAACLRARGVSIAEIVRTLRVTDVSVRSWLNGAAGPVAIARQMSTGDAEPDRLRQPLADARALHDACGAALDRAKMTLANVLGTSVEGFITGPLNCPVSAREPPQSPRNHRAGRPPRTPAQNRC